jgi:hypothetical protein
VFSRGIFPRNVFLERSQEFLFFFLLSQDFFAGIPVGQEFLWDRNSCIYPGILRFLRIPKGFQRDSGGFRFPPKTAGSGQRLKKALC